MEMEIKKIKTYEKLTVPSLAFMIQLKHSKWKNAIVEIGGWLEDEEGTKICKLVELPSPNQNKEEIAGKGTHLDKNFGEKVSYETELVAPLDERKLEHVEEVRSRNEKGDVRLTINLNVKAIRSSSRISHLHLVSPENIEGLPQEVKVQTGKGEKQGEFVLNAYDPDFHTRKTDQWVLSGDGGPQFLEVFAEGVTAEKVIPSSDWIHDFMPDLSLGKWFVVEIPVEEEKELSDVWSYIKKAEQAFRKWDKKEAISNCREAYHSAKKLGDSKIKKRAGVKKWNAMMAGVKKFISKGLHEEEIGEPIYREDAEFVLGTLKLLVGYVAKVIRKES